MTDLPHDQRDDGGSARWILDIIPRAAVTAGLLVLGGWVLWRAVGPPVGAEARIYQDWLEPLYGPGSKDAGMFAEGQVERTLVNGRELFYSRQIVGGSHDEVLDDVEQRVKAVPGPGLAATFAQNADLSEMWPDVDIDKLMGMATMERIVVRLNGDGWGGLAYVDDGCPPGNSPGNSECHKQAIETFMETRDGADIGYVRSVVAIDGGNPYESTVFNVWAEDGFHIGHPDDPADRKAPRLNPPGVDVPAACSIVGSYGQPGTSGGFYGATYDCEAACEPALRDLEPLMTEKGWRSDPLNESLRRQEGATGQRYAMSGVETFVTCTLAEHGRGTSLGVATYVM